MTLDEFKRAGLCMTHEYEVLDDDGWGQNIKYWLEANRLDEDGNVVEVFVHTDWAYSFSFNSNSEDTPRSMLELAEVLIKDAWNNEDI